MSWFLFHFHLFIHSFHTLLLQHTLMYTICTVYVISRSSVLSWSIYQQVSLLKPFKSFPVLLLVSLVTVQWYDVWACALLRGIDIASWGTSALLAFVSSPLITLVGLQLKGCFGTQAKTVVFKAKTLQPWQTMRVKRSYENIKPCCSTTLEII